MIIKYKVAPFLKIKMKWVTKITELQSEKKFIDKQIKGPYSFWEHEHILEKNNQTSQQIISILEKNKFKIKLFPEYWKSSSPNQILKSDYIYGEK